MTGVAATAPSVADGTGAAAGAEGTPSRTRQPLSGATEPDSTSAAAGATGVPPTGAPVASAHRVASGTSGSQRRLGVGIGVRQPAPAPSRRGGLDGVRPPVARASASLPLPRYRSAERPRRALPGAVAPLPLAPVDVGSTSSGSLFSGGSSGGAGVVAALLIVLVLAAQDLGRRLRLQPARIRAPLLAFPLERPG